MEYLTDAGGSLTNSAFTTATLNTPAAAKAITFMRSLITSGASPAAVSTFQEPQAMNTFGGGNAAPPAVVLGLRYRAPPTARRPAASSRPASGVAPLPQLRRRVAARSLQTRRLEPVDQPAQRAT